MAGWAAAWWWLLAPSQQWWHHLPHGHLPALLLHTLHSLHSINEQNRVQLANNCFGYIYIFFFINIYAHMYTRTLYPPPSPIFVIIKLLTSKPFAAYHTRYWSPSQVALSRELIEEPTVRWDGARMRTRDAWGEMVITRNMGSQSRYRHRMHQGKVLDLFVNRVFINWLITFLFRCAS